jgi:hypothetical protein
MLLYDISYIILGYLKHIPYIIISYYKNYTLNYYTLFYFNVS